LNDKTVKAWMLGTRSGMTGPNGVQAKCHAS
jgi:hypothetical protein